MGIYSQCCGNSGCQISSFNVCHWPLGVTLGDSLLNYDHSVGPNPQSMLSRRHLAKKWKANMFLGVALLFAYVKDWLLIFFCTTTGTLCLLKAELNVGWQHTSPVGWCWRIYLKIVGDWWTTDTLNGLNHGRFWLFMLPIAHKFDFLLIKTDWQAWAQRCTTLTLHAVYCWSFPAHWCTTLPHEHVWWAWLDVVICQAPDTESLSQEWGKCSDSVALKQSKYSKSLHVVIQ